MQAPKTIQHLKFYITNMLTIVTSLAKQIIALMYYDIQNHVSLINIRQKSVT